MRFIASSVRTIERKLLWLGLGICFGRCFMISCLKPNAFAIACWLYSSEGVALRIVTLDNRRATTIRLFKNSFSRKLALVNLPPFQRAVDRWPSHVSLSIEVIEVKSQRLLKMIIEFLGIDLVVDVKLTLAPRLSESVDRRSSIVAFAPSAKISSGSDCFLNRKVCMIIPSRVVFVMKSISGGGAETQVRLLERCLRGYQIKCEHRIVPSDCLGVLKALFLECVASLGSKQTLTVFCSIHPASDALVFVLSKFVPRSKAVIRESNSVGARRTFSQRFAKAVLAFDRVITNNQAFAENAHSMGLVARKTTVRFQPNLPDPQFWSTTIKPRKNLQARRIQILVGGRSKPHKRIGEILELLSTVSERFLWQFEVFLVGAHEFRSHHIDLSKVKIVGCGWLSCERLGSVMSCCDLVMNLSDYEGQSNLVFEAVGQGCIPILAENRDGHSMKHLLKHAYLLPDFFSGNGDVRIAALDRILSDLSSHTASQLSEIRLENKKFHLALCQEEKYLEGFCF